MTDAEIQQKISDRTNRMQIIATFFGWELLWVHWPVEGACFSCVVDNEKKRFDLESSAVRALLEWIERNER